MSRGSGPPSLDLTEWHTVSDKDSLAVADLVAAATAADGTGPIDDQVRSELRHGAGAASRHVLGHDLSGRLAAYAHYTRDEAGASGHLVVHPAHRRHGYGTTLLHHLRRQPSKQPAGDQSTLRIWAHGDLPEAQALAAAESFTRIRELWQMHRPLAPALPPPSYPDDVIVRTFRPGVDDEAWVALNAAAFATHPEQGRLTVEDLRHRMAEPWFDPEGFFLAARGERLLGSHWTKVHPARPDAPGDADAGTRAIGEVYAVGVHPDAQGLGLGKALTLSGLHYLRDHGLDDVMLYVDGDNGAAVGLYERLGFTKTTVDVMYAG